MNLRMRETSTQQRVQTNRIIAYWPRPELSLFHHYRRYHFYFPLPLKYFHVMEISNVYCTVPSTQRKKKNAKVYADSI